VFVSSSKKARVVDWYQEIGTRSQAERGVAWDRPVGHSGQLSIVTRGRGNSYGESGYCRRIPVAVLSHLGGSG
jgi:hypothetical protein